MKKASIDASCVMKISLPPIQNTTLVAAGRHLMMSWNKEKLHCTKIAVTQVLSQIHQNIHILELEGHSILPKFKIIFGNFKMFFLCSTPLLSISSGKHIL